MNVMMFAAAFLIMAVVMAVLLNNAVSRISSAYSEQFAVSSADALSAHVDKELGLIALAARAYEVVEWLADEGDENKKALAVDKMLSIVKELYSYNLYLVFGESLNNYRIWADSVTGNILHVGVLERGNPQDEWYYDLLESEEGALLSIGIDHELQRKRLWLDYSVEREGVQLGAISTGLEFSHMAGELFSQYETSNMRGLIVDEAGIVHMDSDLMDDGDFLFGDFAPRIDEVFSDPKILGAIKQNLGVGAGNAEGSGRHAVVRVHSGPYRNVTITPIRSTGWSLVILSGSTSFFSVSYFIPILGIMLLLLLTVALVTSAANYRLIFLPLGKLDKSLASLRYSLEGRISGTERDDELGALSRTIQDLFTKANVDGLTGIYNRRFMENNLEQIMGMLSRLNGYLSVLMLDIDYFKKYNDMYGHDQGDECLKSVAQALALTVTRSSDFIARYGGEEFLVVLTNTDVDGALVVAEKLLENVRALEIPHADSTVAPFVTVSIGGATDRVVYGQKWEEYVKRADEALYVSKQTGRNKITFSKQNGQNGQNGGQNGQNGGK